MIIYSYEEDGRYGGQTETDGGLPSGNYTDIKPVDTTNFWDGTEWIAPAEEPTEAPTEEPIEGEVTP